MASVTPFSVTIPMITFKGKYPLKYAMDITPAVFVNVPTMAVGMACFVAL